MLNTYVTSIEVNCRLPLIVKSLPSKSKLFFILLHAVEFSFQNISLRARFFIDNSGIRMVGTEC